MRATRQESPATVRGITKRRGSVAVIAGVLLGLASATVPASMAVATPSPSIGGGGTVNYTEQAAPVLVGPGLTVADGASYDGKYVDFSVGSAAASDLLSLSTSGSANTSNGVVSIVGGTVYLGNGTTADPIGSVDSTKDGQAGRDLRVNFTSAFANASFETGDLTGWTAINSVIDLGVTSIAGFATSDTSTYPGNVTNEDNNYPQNPGSFSTTIDTDRASDGTHSLRLLSASMTTQTTCDVVHGPAVYSSTFSAAAGDSIYFDWQAQSGQDNYHVFGYIVDGNGVQTEVLDATGGNSANWTTKATVIPTTGTYRFVFVSGTHDLTCGRAAGASLYVDNVRVFGSKATDDVVQQVARLVQYANTSDNPPTSRTVTVTAVSASNGTATGTTEIAIAGVDDPPSLAAISGVTLTNTLGAQTYSPTTGALAGSDPDGDAIVYSVTGGTASAATIGGVAYTDVITGTYGDLHLNATTGAYVFVPNAAATDARLTGDSETFTLVATASGQTSSRPFAVTVAVPPSVPDVPTGLVATAGAEQASLSWVPPTWLGGSAIQHYIVEASTDGGTTWAVVQTTATNATTTVVTGLAAGTAVTFRVSAVNTTGASAPSATSAATPFGVPSAPTITSLTPANRTLTVSYTAPSFDGGSAITGYEFSTDGGVTWVAKTPRTSAGKLIVTLSGLVNGTAVDVRVRAVNAAGAGAASVATPGTPSLEPIPAPSIVGTVIPEVKPGSSIIVVDGEAATARVTTTRSVWTVTDGNFSIGLEAHSSTGDAYQIDTAGRLVVTDQGSVAVSGSGFAPGTLVDVWMFSTPHLLGQALVKADGTFVASFPLPAGIPIGDHTVQLNGMSAAGEVRSVSTGIVVRSGAAQPIKSSASALAATGADTSDALTLIALVVIAGAGLVTVSRVLRRRATR